MARHNSKQDYGTPRDFIEAVERRWGALSFDLAADAENYKASKPVMGNPQKPYYDADDDSLVCDWGKLGGTLWLNPPFANIAPWAEKCEWEASRASKQFKRILLLVPASVGSEWFSRFLFNKAVVYFLTGRLSFDGKAPYPKDCMVVEYSDQAPGVHLWRWKV